MTKKKQKKESVGEWSRRVFGYTKDGWLYVNNKKVSYVGPDEYDDDFTALMGAEAIQILLTEVDMEKETQTIEQKQCIGKILSC